MEARTDETKGMNPYKFQMILWRILLHKRCRKRDLNVSSDHDCSISHQQLYNFWVMPT